MAQVTLEITAEDFEHFSFTSMEWAKNKFELQSDRFDPEAKYDWEMAYWCEMDYAAALMATAFLKSIGEKYQIISDESEEFCGWVILTNYRTSNWLDK